MNDEDLLSGHRSEASRTAMSIIVEMARVALDERDYRSLSTGETISVDATGDPATLRTDQVTG